MIQSILIGIALVWNIVNSLIIGYHPVEKYKGYTNYDALGLGTTTPGLNATLGVNGSIFISGSLLNVGLINSTSSIIADTLTASSTTGTSTIVNALQLGSTRRDNELYVNASSRLYPASVSTGGAINCDEGTQAQFPCLVLHDNSSGVGTGRLLVINQEGTSVTQDMFVASSSCSNCTAINVKGAPTGKGVVKLEHTGGGTGYANGSLLSLDKLNATDVQGIFGDSTGGVSTGKWIQFKNFGTEYFNVSAIGAIGVGSSTVSNTLEAVFATSTANSTSTIAVGKSGQNKGSCLELFDSSGNPVFVMIPVGTTAFNISSTPCN